jgi:hypothetical protein
MKRIWYNTWLREFVIFVATATAIVVVSQLQALDTLFSDGADVDELRTWAASAGSAIGITAIRQSIAFVIARLAGSTL